jgi:hypothetical protein
MLSRGDLNREQLLQALAAQRRGGVGRIGEWIEKLGFAPEAQVTAAVAAQWGCPVLKTVPERLVDTAIPIPLLRRFSMAPVHYVNATRVMHIAFAGCIEYRALLAIEQMLQCRAEPCMTSSTALARVLARLDDENNRRSHLFEDVPRREDMVRITSSYAARLGAEDVRLTACGEYVWIRLDAGAESANLLFSLPSDQLCCA